MFVSIDKIGKLAHALLLVIIFSTTHLKWFGGRLALSGTRTARLNNIHSLLKYQVCHIRIVVKCWQESSCVWSINIFFLRYPSQGHLSLCSSKKQKKNTLNLYLHSIFCGLTNTYHPHVPINVRIYNQIKTSQPQY